MKKMLIRLIALLMALSCAVTLFGCEEEEETSSRRRRKKTNKETTEEVTDFDETTGDALWEEDEATEEVWKENVEKVEETTEAPAEPPKTGHAPGTYGMPAIELMELTYAELVQLRWNSTETEDGERWIFRADSCDCTFMFVFDGKYQDPYAKPAVMNIEDTYDKGYAYLTKDIQICDPAYQLPDEVANKIGPMDGGLYASVTVNGYPVDILFDGDMDHVDDAQMYLIQVRQEG